MLKRIYGNDRTNLQLSDKAQHFYSGEELLTITEYEDRDEDRTTRLYTYRFGNDMGSPLLTAEQLNAELEDMADAMAIIE